MGPAESDGEARWRVRGVSVQGYSHLRDGIECQDAYRHAFHKRTGTHLLAVADGAGSRVRSAEGASLAVGLSVGEFSERLARGGVPATADDWHRLLAEAFATVIEMFRSATDRLGSSSDFAATLTVAILAPPWLATASLGDGVVIVGAEALDGTTLLHLIVHAQPAGEFVNETQFLTSARALDHMSTTCVRDPGLSAVLLATDGVVPVGVQRDGAAWRPNSTFVEPVLASLGAARSNPTEVTRLLLDDRISRLSADDKTLLAAVRS
jgi:hypothetical protein